MRPAVPDNGITSGDVLAKGPSRAAFGAAAIAKICRLQPIAARDKPRSDFQPEWHLHTRFSDREAHAVG